MAKLVEILARELKEWPEPFDAFMQGPEGQIYLGDGMTLTLELADDWLTDVVTRAQWEAERARIATNQQATAEAREIARTGAMTAEEQELADIACGKRSREDQELWDKVAIAAVNGEMACQSNAVKRLDAGDLVRYSMTVADAFMAERAKRMKGGA